MRTMLLAIVVMCSFAAVAGRYEVKSLDFYDQTREETVSLVIKVDTETGRTWRLERRAVFSRGTSDFVMVEGWIDLNYEYHTTIDDADRKLNSK